MIKKISIFLILLFACFGSTAFAASPISDDVSSLMVNQADALNSAGGSVTIFEEASLSVIVANIIKAFLSLLGIIFVVLMILGGYNWMTAQGDESKVEKAKSTIQKAIIGLIIIVSTYSITYTIFKFL